MREEDAELLLAQPSGEPPPIDAARPMAAHSWQPRAHDVATPPVDFRVNMAASMASQAATRGLRATTSKNLFLDKFKVLQGCEEPPRDANVNVRPSFVADASYSRGWSRREQVSVCPSGDVLHKVQCGTVS